MRSFFLLFFLVVLAAPRAYPWGAEGHEAIAEVAQGMLTGLARAKVEAILGKNRMPAVATWLDDVRNAQKHHVGPLKDDPEAKAFNSKFPDNDEWHYVNLPVGHTTYSESLPFASKNDIVHAIDHCVDVLEGRAVDMTPVQALQCLIHLVGDVHQPLHTVAGYYDLKNLRKPKLISAAGAAVGKPSDRGANSLFYTKSLELHAYWDKKMPEKVQRERPELSLARQLASVSTPQKYLTPGDYHQWAEKWVGDSATEAINLYKGIKFGEATLDDKGRLERIEIDLPASYDDLQTARAKAQLSKAACRLAQLLNVIKYK
jgi:hypothetical protein